MPPMEGCCRRDAQFIRDAADRMPLAHHPDTDVPHSQRLARLVDSRVRADAEGAAAAIALEPLRAAGPAIPGEIPAPAMRAGILVGRIQGQCPLHAGMILRVQDGPKLGLFPHRRLVDESVRFHGHWMAFIPAVPKKPPLEKTAVWHDGLKLRQANRKALIIIGFQPKPLHNYNRAAKSQDIVVFTESALNVENCYY